MAVMTYFDDPFADPNDPNDPNNQDALGDFGMGGQTGPWTGGVTGTGTNPMPGATPSPNPTPGARTYNPMAGWDTGKLNGDGNTLKYQFGRFVQDRGFDPVWARQNMGDVVNQWNQFSGGNARATSDDRINFGTDYGDVDVLNGGNYWQWGAWSDPNQQQGGANSLSGLMGVTGSSTTPTAPTWTAMQQNSSAYGQSPLATAKRKPASTLAQLLGGQ